MTRILVFTPAFHGYGDSIGNALRRRGHDVTVHPYDAHVRAWDKARHKLTVSFPASSAPTAAASAAGVPPTRPSGSTPRPGPTRWW